ncbi:MAG: metallophosphoesterase [Pseudomonadota bacterium]
MKVLHVGDLHYALKQFDWLLDEAEHYDLVVCAGDLLDISAAVPIEAQIVVVLTYLENLAARTQVVVCSGNHDLNRAVAGGAAGERVAGWLDLLDQFSICHDGQHRVFGRTLLSALPWWDGPVTKASVVAQLQRDAAHRPSQGRWIWAHHAPPAKARVSWNGNRHFGDLELLDWIETFEPDLVLSGHVHPAPFVPGGAWVDRVGSAWCFNMGHQIGPVPCHIALNLEPEEEAVWMSEAGPERLSLARADAPEALTALPDWV